MVGSMIFYGTVVIKGSKLNSRNRKIRRKERGCEVNTQLQKSFGLRLGYLINRLHKLRKNIILTISTAVFL